MRDTLTEQRTAMQERVAVSLSGHRSVLVNPGRRLLIEEAVTNREAVVSACGALATWTPPESTGRVPDFTVLVNRPESASQIDWSSPNNIPIDPETFDQLFEEALRTMASKKRLYVTDRVLGADVRYALPVRVVTPKALTGLFTDNMFRPVPQGMGRSIFHGKGFILLALPEDKLGSSRYEGRLPASRRRGGKATDMIVATDFDRRIGIVFGSSYCGTVKKMMFTAMNYLLPGEGILPLHAAANEGPRGDTALLLGLSGTGKTTLSADPRRKLLGDDEHGWSDFGLSNFEYGCFAKLIRLDPSREPEIHNACFHEEDWRSHGAIIENALIYPDGRFDLNDSRLTENSRGSFLLSAMGNVKEPPVGGHPETILFLAADANGVLPPVSRLSREQAMLWFLMGYTSKLAGTEAGVTTPAATFSRFFGGPFMPRNPDDYAALLGKKLQKHGTEVFLINTGWSGGPYGTGKRIDILETRAMVHAALSGRLEGVEYEEDKLFHLLVPKKCPGVSNPAILQPRNTWADPAEYDRRARKLAEEFSAYFDKAYGTKGIAPEVAAQCPGK